MHLPGFYAPVNPSISRSYRRKQLSCVYLKEWHASCWEMTCIQTTKGYFGKRERVEHYRAYVCLSFLYKLKWICIICIYVLLVFLCFCVRINVCVYVSILTSDHIPSSLFLSLWTGCVQTPSAVRNTALRRYSSSNNRAYSTFVHVCVSCPLLKLFCLVRDESDTERSSI